ncbi:GNAT family N-acetyltransferase [Streptomyces sp. NBC_01429]|uniref:GNAT family N-acetyltransferase n=1 Tax=Streptomyces sp. NBC_01429 TaxID=2903862 RepID=UPI002E2C0059|nr:GNAT family protein [Streptomyces sp. NBC_01429]
MLRGESVGLRARQEADVPVLHAELYGDVAGRARVDSGPWLPIPAASAEGPFSVGDPGDGAVSFSVVELASEELAGAAVLWGIDTHNRSAHLGLSLRPAFRGRGLGVDAVRVLCGYGFVVRGLHRLQLETLADNTPMIRAAGRVGFTREGTLRRNAWVSGEFVDEVVLGLLAEEWGDTWRP